MNMTEQAKRLVRLSPGYTAGYYCTALGISRSQFGAIARKHLTRSDDFSYTAWFPKESS